jgi:hypothetical protein
VKTKYDSTPDTVAHIKRVRELLYAFIANLERRAVWHDISKLEEEEKPFFDKLTPKLNALTYGSEEYRACLQKLEPALKHHYKVSSHHPEHYANGIYGMSLLDLLEMLADWKAAGERHASGSLERSLMVNQTRFAIDDRLQRILEQTAAEMGWLP